MLKLLLVGLLAYVGLAAFLYTNQSRFVYFPDMPGRDLSVTPAAIGLKFEALSLPTSDGEVLDAWYVPAAQPRGTLLFFHGNAGNMSHRLESIAIFNRLGLNVLIFDYRGYGRSSGKVSESGTYGDAKAVWHYLTADRGVDPASIILFGRSLGGAIAVWLAAKVQPAGLIIESSFISVSALGAELYPWLPVRWLSRIHYDSRERLAHVRSPVLVIHSREDEIVPFHHGQALFDAAHEPKQLLEIGGGHNAGFLLTKDRYERGLKAFIEAVAL